MCIRDSHNSDQNIAAIDRNFAGCGRYITEGNGAYQFITIQPGPYPYPNRGIEWRPMHIHFSIFGQSFGQRLITQMYFEGDPLIKFCPMVNSIPDAKAKKSLMNFYRRKNTLSLGVCNGCQLFIELGLINEDHLEKPKMTYNDSNKFECVFSTVDIKESPSIMLKSLEGLSLIHISEPTRPY